MDGSSRNPKNAPGAFYVLEGQCVSCDAPRAEAPGLVTLDDEVGCYFHKQPETPAEVDDAVRAVIVSCVEVYRYGGSDLAIRRRLAQSGHADLCDQPLRGEPVVVRNCVRFSLGERDEPGELARLLVSWFDAVWKGGRCTKAVTADAHHARFEYTYSSPRGTPRRYALERLPPSVGVGPPSVYRDPSTVQAWLLTEKGRGYPPIWLHDILVKNGAVNIRWFSRDEWLTGAPGEALPY